MSTTPKHELSDLVIEDAFNTLRLEFDYNLACIDISIVNSDGVGNTVRSYAYDINKLINWLAQGKQKLTIPKESSR